MRRGNQTSATQLHQRRSEPPSRWAIFCNFLEKTAILMPFGLHFTQFLEPFERIKFLRFESQLKKFFSLLQVKSKTR